MGLGGLPHPGLPNLPPGQMNYALQQHYMQEVYRVAAMQQIQNSLKTNEAFANLSPMDQNRICLQYYMASHSMSRPAGFGDQTPIMNLLSSMGPPPLFGLPPSLMKEPQTEAGWPPQPVTTASAPPTAESRGTSVWDADSSIVSAGLAMPAPPSRNVIEALWQQQQLASQSLLAEQMRAKEEEERRAQELQKQARLEEERRLLEEQRLLEERRKEEEEQKRRQQEAEALQKEEEERRKREEEEMRKRQEEEEKQRKLEEQKRKAEEQKRKCEEQKRKIEEQKRKEEEQRQLEEELMRQQRIEEERKRAMEVEKRKEEERKAEEAWKVAEEKKRHDKAAKQAAFAAAASAAAATSTQAATVAAAPTVPPVKKSPSKVSVIDADEFMALKQPPKQQKVELPKPEKPQGPVWGGKPASQHHRLLFRSLRFSGCRRRKRETWRPSGSNSSESSSKLCSRPCCSNSNSSSKRRPSRGHHEPRLLPLGL
uniref:Putative maverick pol n=1 Tax=Amblyomma cajennense TaxID=34607 RepID=A0A023FEN8_AMBCJ